VAEEGFARIQRKEDDSRPQKFLRVDDTKEREVILDKGDDYEFPDEQIEQFDL
jgi:hypothetical protein